VQATLSNVHWTGADGVPLACSVIAAVPPAEPYPGPVTVTTPSLTVHAPPSTETTRAPG
jgi:hypothetical protein